MNDLFSAEKQNGITPNHGYDQLRVLVACEESQAVTKELRLLGVEAFSCDLLPCSGGHPEWHFQKDVTELLKEKWDMIIAFPPCTYLTVSGLHWNKKNPERAKKTEEAFDFFMLFANADCDFIAIENPIGCVSSKWKRPNQIINPYEFGSDASKSTCLWLKGLPILTKGTFVEPRIVEGKKRWSNQMDNGQNITLNEKGKVVGWNTDEIKILRSKTYPGVANSMAVQWAEYLLKTKCSNWS